MKTQLLKTNKNVIRKEQAITSDACDESTRPDEDPPGVPPGSWICVNNVWVYVPA